MTYESFSAERFFTEITTEAEARPLLWRSRFQGKEFHCPRGHAEQFYALATRSDVRTGNGCRRQLRLRAGTIFESSKTALLLWVKALFLSCRVSAGYLPKSSSGIWV